MKILKNLLFVCILAVLTACSEDAIAPQAEIIPSTGEESVDLISMVVPDIEIADATTRSKFIDDGTELKFVWQENDAIGVVPMAGAPLYFPIQSENIQNNTAIFDGGRWAMKTNEKYAAFYPITQKNQKTDVKHISIDYTGQTQSNYMNYDFLATGAVQPKDGAVKFTMQRLSAILKIQVNVSADNHVQYCSLSAKDAVFGLKGTLDLSGTNPVYTPEVMTRSINTSLVTDKISSDETFTFYLMIPPTDLSGKVLTLLLNSDSGTAKRAIFTGQNFEAGKAYVLNLGLASDPLIKNANLIAAAGLSDISSTQINVWANRERILKVTSIDVSGLDDPTVCDDIRYFRNLTSLTCYSNQLTSLDVSNNPALVDLNCRNNQLTSLDVSNNMALKTLFCSQNQMTSLDLSNNTALTYLNCHFNELASLDLSNNKALTYLNCGINQLTSLDVSNNAVLIDLLCDSNQLTSLDVSNNLLLKRLDCSFNQLTSLNVDNNKELVTLNCGANKITKFTVDTSSEGLKNLRTLDISYCKGLDELNCYPKFGSRGFLTTLKITECTNLTLVNCSWNQLTSLEIPTTTTLWFGLSCHNNLLKTLDISKCTKLPLNVIYCGSQWTNANKTTSQTMTLYYSSQNTGTFTSTSAYNTYVTLVKK